MNKGIRDMKNNRNLFSALNVCAITDQQCTELIQLSRISKARSVFPAILKTTVTVSLLWIVFILLRYDGLDNALWPFIAGGMQ